MSLNIALKSVFAVLTERIDLGESITDFRAIIKDCISEAHHLKALELSNLENQKSIESNEQNSNTTGGGESL